jgi:hypothetical protein
MENLSIQKNKGGRPKVDDFNKKSQVISVRYTETELATIEVKSKMAAKSVRDFIRESALNSEVKSKISVEQFSEIKKINLIGNNLNQLTKLAYQRGYDKEANLEFCELKEKLNDCVTQLITNK